MGTTQTTRRIVTETLHCTLAPGWAAQHDFSEEGKRQLLGQVSEVDYFESDIRNWATVQGLDLTVYRVNANFGR
ncbi:MAG: hypothetical protein ACK5Q4_03520, partial [Phycisphaerae bacterium]